MALKMFGRGFVRTIERRKKRREDVRRRKTRMTFLQCSTAASKNKLKDASTSLDNLEFFRRNYFETFHHESARTPLESEKENCLIANETEARILFSHLGKTLKQTPDDPDVVDLTRRPREEKSYAYDFGRFLASEKKTRRKNRRFERRLRGVLDAADCLFKD